MKHWLTRKYRSRRWRRWPKQRRRSASQWRYCTRAGAACAPGAGRGGCAAGIGPPEPECGRRTLVFAGAFRCAAGGTGRIKVLPQAGWVFVNRHGCAVRQESSVTSTAIDPPGMQSAAGWCDQLTATAALLRHCPPRDSSRPQRLKQMRRYAKLLEAIGRFHWLNDREVRVSKTDPPGTADVAQPRCAAC